METAKAINLYEAYMRYGQAGDYRSAFACLEKGFRGAKKQLALLNGFRKVCKKHIKDGDRIEMFYELLHKSYVLSAPYRFDDFMIALEWYRPPEKKFWLPRREKLLAVCEAMQDLADDKLDELFLSQPPRTGKSTLVMMWLIWQMCRDPEATNLYSSYTKDVVDIFFNGILEIFNDSDTYDLQTIFPKAVVANTNAAIGFMNVGRKKKYPSFMCRAINAALNGLADASGAIVIDDIHSGIDEARNPDLLAKTWSTVSNNLLSRRKGGTKHLWIGTRWSIYDCISRRIDLIQTNPNFKNWRYKIVNVPALNDKDESNFDYPYGLGFSTDAFKKVRASFAESDDMASWLAQFMGTPIERDGAVFEPSAMRYYNGELPKEEPDRVFMAVDPSWGGGDYVAACVVVQYGNELYIPDVVYSNTDKYGSEPLVVECAIRNNVAAMYVEGTRVTGTYADELSARFKERGYYINLQRTTKHWASQSGKTQRIFDRAPDIKSKMVFLDEQNRSREYQQFMQSVFSFTYEGKNKHDDAPDCLAMAIVHLMQRAQKVRSISWSVLDGISA